MITKKIKKKEDMCACGFPQSSPIPHEHSRPEKSNVKIYTDAHTAYEVGKSVGRQEAFAEVEYMMEQHQKRDCNCYLNGCLKKLMILTKGKLNPLKDAYDRGFLKGCYFETQTVKELKAKHEKELEEKQKVLELADLEINLEQKRHKKELQELKAEIEIGNKALNSIKLETLQSFKDDLIELNLWNNQRRELNPKQANREINNIVKKWLAEIARLKK
jgi:hypothetical protein